MWLCQKLNEILSGKVLSLGPAEFGDCQIEKTSGGSRISQTGTTTPEVEEPTYYLVNFFPKTA